MALSFSEQLQRFVQPITRKIGSMICCALVKAVNDSGKIQLLKINMYQDETKDKVERIQEFGFTSNPPDDSEAVVLFMGGNRSHGIVVATDGSKYRIKNLERGGVALYNSNGDKVVLTRDKIEVTADTVNIVAGTILLGDGFMQKRLATEDFVNQVYKVHTHASAPDGPESPPKTINCPTELTSKTKAE